MKVQPLIRSAFFLCGLWHHVIIERVSSWPVLRYDCTRLFVSMKPRMLKLGPSLLVLILLQTLLQLRAYSFSFVRRSFLRQLSYNQIRTTTPRWASPKSTDGNSVASSQQAQLNSFISRLETPQSILHPYFPSSRPVPFPRALHLLKQALEKIECSDNKYTSTSQTTTTTILRLEQVLSHPVDPLCWLDAQQQSWRGAAFYMASEHMEGAMVGNALSNTTIRSSTSDDVFDLVQHLPAGARVYGGARFDASSSSDTIRDEWKAYGNAVWMLPVVELVRFQQNQTTTVAVHLVATVQCTLQQAARAARLFIASAISSRQSARMPPTTLPPVMSRDSNYDDGAVDGQELFEQGIAQALESLQALKLQKVVLARKQRLQFALVNKNNDWTALQVLKRWMYGGSEGGHLFWMRPGPDAPEFFGCTPERLFSIRNGQLESEALAGTRPRGSTQSADDELLQELFASPKDRQENSVTGQFIKGVFDKLEAKKWIQQDNSTGIFVRRLLHLQHICQRYSAAVGHEHSLNVARELFDRLHPTPAIGGLPVEASRDFIRKFESTGFDRGFYSGPIGYISRDSSDILVAIRSGLASLSPNTGRLSIDVYAGVGVVPGSTLRDEWAETNYKLAVISSLFPQSPMPLQSAPTANVAWASAFVEELIRNGVTQFYVCPGSRSTPLVVAVARAVRSYLGVVHAVSVHDERAAGFRAVGYGRGTGRPAVVITSSGTAVANLYPAIVEAGMDGIALVVLTADRPYENKNTGANQAIDQVKMFSSSYVRWFRDILPPDDQVPVSAALSDASHSVHVAKSLRGPVHVNIQLRENLAPDTGPIRNDGRAGAVTKFNGLKFTDVPGYRHWSTLGDTWTKSYAAMDASADYAAVKDTARLIANSKRGIIVVGNIRGSNNDEYGSHMQLLDQISIFAESIGFPIFAGAQCAGLRFRSSAVIPFAEHLLKSSLVSDNLKPDLVIQLGAPLISSAIYTAIEETMRKSEEPTHHVLVHPIIQNERIDPSSTVTHTISCGVASFLESLTSLFEDGTFDASLCSSKLAPLVLLGRKVQSEMKDIIKSAASIATGSSNALTEPEIIAAMSEQFTNNNVETSLFLSNSMPVRDSEFFLYPFYNDAPRGGIGQVGTNRGASGIDGIISSAVGFSEATGRPTTLLIGDLATLHDLNSMHALTNVQQTTSQSEAGGKDSHALTTIIVNNDGGGIFSFLPIAKHGADVGFDDFFGTPTRTFSFENGAKAFGLPVEVATTSSDFKKALELSRNARQHNVIEARVADRETNVNVHAEITKGVTSLIDQILTRDTCVDSASQRIAVKFYTHDDKQQESSTNTLLLLHGWNGDKSEWDEAATILHQSLPTNWTILSVDLPGHGKAPLCVSSDVQTVRSALRLNRDGIEYGGVSVDSMAATILNSLSQHYGIKRINAVAGYSLGGRVALEMKRLCKSPPIERALPVLMRDDAKLILLSTFPGNLSIRAQERSSPDPSDEIRSKMDDELSAKLDALSAQLVLRPPLSDERNSVWTHFLEHWYSAPLWGNLSQNYGFNELINKRADSLSLRGKDIAMVLSQSSPPKNNQNSWRSCSAESTLFIAGDLDEKYSRIGKTWSNQEGVCFKSVADAGHALLVESPSLTANIMLEFLSRGTLSSDKYEAVPSKQTPVFGTAAMTKSQTLDQLRQKPSPIPVFREVVTDSPRVRGSIDSLDLKEFQMDIYDATEKSSRITGIGWGDNAKPVDLNHQSMRRGIIIQLISPLGLEVGIGEISPLAGLHLESFDDARSQVEMVRQILHDKRAPIVNASQVLALDGGLSKYVQEFEQFAGVKFLPSVYSGIEMAVLSLATQAIGLPLHQSTAKFASVKTTLSSSLAINSLSTRGHKSNDKLVRGSVTFPSTKVKVGHQTRVFDAKAMSAAYQSVENYRGALKGMVRADANRCWNESQAMEFISSLEGLALQAHDRFEFIEEPLQKVPNGPNAFERQVKSLERLYEHTDVAYSLDESLADCILENEYNFKIIAEKLIEIFGRGRRGCAAFVLKPALIGVELSMQIARLARAELGIGAVFSASFDSGVGLAHAALLASLSDGIESSARQFPHGIGTFEFLASDILNPAFSTYINEFGILNVPSLSRALYGLSLDDISESLAHKPRVSVDRVPSERVNNKTYEASTASSSSGSEISVVVAMPLPFSAEIAANRFTDLPQQSRWSPWISSVAYQGEETEWTLNVKGIPLRWRAKSQLLTDPPGIEWESVSGLSNRGSAVFVPDSKETCQMKVQMTLLTPRLLRPVFKGTSLFLEEFLREKLLKWSLEMFRDVVKADLALERGDVELGDALFGAVEGKANAIVESLSPPTRID
jgi:2-succinyl-5-enolpyruvyl-6-hydroxy-3-cyclohexene-1-carboxylate synthase